MSAYYNDIDDFSVKVLKSLIKKGLIPDGEVDNRSVKDVKPDDIKNFTQCHFFAGVGGWPYALRLAGWPDDKPVWTGSVPCQPFSGAGKRRGVDDERHLWPAFFNLISKCSIPTVFGEQVSGPLGRTWLAAIRLDLESIGYTCGAADLPAAGVGAPHKRNRLFWVSNSSGSGWEKDTLGRKTTGTTQVTESSSSDTATRRLPVRICQPDSTGRGEREYSAEKEREECIFVATSSDDNRVCHSDSERLERHARNVAQLNESGWHGPFAYGPSSASSVWSESVYLPFQDGKWRPIPTEPSLFPLAYGVSKRVDRLRVIGNAIVPQVAAAFIEASGLLDETETPKERIEK